MKNNAAIRDMKIDRLRFIGMICVMMAHTIPSDLIMEIRSFDVVCLVFISAFCTKPIDSFKNYLAYIWKRIKKLVFPTWGIITIVLLGTLVCDLLLGYSYMYSAKSIILSYTLIDGIGYVWIVRIFMMIAIILPLIQKVTNKIQSRFLFIALVFSMVISTEVIFYLSRGMGQFFVFLFDYFLIPFIGYSCVALIAYRIKQNGKNVAKRALFPVLLLVAVICVALLCGERGIFVTSFKYPPRSVYLIYGLGVTLLLFRIIKSNPVKRCPWLDKVVVYVSSYSFNIYFIHILLMKILQYCNLHGCSVSNSYLLAVINITLSIIISWVIFRAKKHIKETEFLKHSI